MVYFAHFLYDAPAAKEGFMDESFQLEILFKRGRTSKVYTCTAISIQWYLGKKIKINAKVVSNLRLLF